MSNNLQEINVQNNFNSINEGHQQDLIKPKKQQKKEELQQNNHHNHNHNHNHGQGKNKCVYYYTIFTCLSCVLLQTQYFNPFLSDFRSSYLSYLAYFELVMSFFSYYQAITIKNTVPKLRKVGTIQAVSQPIVDPSYDVKKICQKCNFTKFPRVSHCSTCAECIYKLDHHCIWTQSCIGYCNQRAFYLYTFFMTCGGAQFWYSTFRVWNSVNNISQLLSLFEPGVYILWIISCISSTIIAPMIWLLAASHSLMILTNFVTLDSFKKSICCPLPICEYRRSYYKPELINQYDRGQIQNIRALFGTNIFTFWIPFARPITNQLIIQPMNPYPMKNSILNDKQSQEEGEETSKLAKKIEKAIPELKNLYKGKNVLINGEIIVL